LEYARTVGADLVALSARGEGGSSRFVFGSTAGRLAAAAECPVLVSPTRAGDVAGEHGKRDRVLVALDGSPSSEAAILPAAEVARHQGSALVLVHVVEALWAADDSAAASVQARKVKEMEERLRQLTARAATSGVRALSLIVRGDAASEILAQAERRRAQLLCLSVTARGFTDRLFFGSVAEKVIPRAQVPLLLVRRDPSSAS
jgi:nucleotide-binding universal stress UspA family protein